VIEAPGTTLLPGLIDAHVHLCGDGTDGTLERLGSVPEDVLPSVIEQSLRRQLAAGVTTVRDLGDRRYAVVDWNARRRPDDGLPTIVAAGPPITSVGGHCANMGGEVAGAERIRAAVRARAERGVDVVKIMGSGGFMTTGTEVLRCQFELDELSAAVDEAHRLGLPVTVHAHPRVAVLQAMAAGADGIEHCSFFTEAGQRATAADLAEFASRQIAACITSGVVGAARMPPAAQAFLQPLGLTAEDMVAGMKRHAAALHRAGVRVVAGADSGIGSAKPHGIVPVTVRFYVDGGMRVADALAAATAKAADACGVGARKGRIRPGYDADLLLVDGDALTDVAALARPRAVCVGGRQSWAISDHPVTSDGFLGAGPM
jgi:imidazolonepropionase-like amidohydrolase